MQRGHGRWLPTYPGFLQPLFLGEHLFLCRREGSSGQNSINHQRAHIPTNAAQHSKPRLAAALAVTALRGTAAATATACLPATHTRPPTPYDVAQSTHGKDKDKDIPQVWGSSALQAAKASVG